MAWPPILNDNPRHDPRDTQVEGKKSKQWRGRPKLALEKLLDGYGLRAQLARALKVNEREPGRWISGERYMSNKMVIRAAFVLDVPVTTILDYPLFDKWATGGSPTPQILENVTADSCADCLGLSRRNRAFFSELPEHDHLIFIDGEQGWLSGFDEISLGENENGLPVVDLLSWGENPPPPEIGLTVFEETDYSSVRKRLEGELATIPGDWRDLNTLYADMASLFAQTLDTYERAEFVQQLEAIRHVWRGRRAGTRFPRKIL